MFKVYIVNFEHVNSGCIRAIFHITFGFISDINTQDQAQISIMDTNANLKQNQVDAANTQNKLESETRLNSC